MKKIITYFFCLIFFFNAQAQAEELYGLAMHGQPKYAVNFQHLDYVNPAAPQGGSIKQAAIGTFDTLNPFSIKGKAAEGLNLVYDRLMARVWDEPFTLYPLIAEKIDVPEDRSALTVHLNPAARFHDGTPITADDVLFSFETMKAKGRPNMRRIYRLVETIEKRNDHTIRFTFGPGHDQETVMIIAMMPVLSKGWWEQHDFDSTILEHPLGNGPYRIVKTDPGRQIIYEHVPDYWAADLPVNRGHFNFSTLIYDYYRDNTVAFEAFKAGETDLRREWDAGKWNTAYDFPAIHDGSVKKENFSHGRPERVRSLIFNTRRPPFDNRKVREALNYALDFDWLNSNLFHGQYKRISSYFPNASLAAQGLPDEEEKAILEPWREQLPPEIFGTAWQPPQTQNSQQKRLNLRKADTLLKEAGWIVKNGKRVRVDDEQNIFKFEIMLDSPENEKIALSFVSALKRLGIQAQVRVLDSAAYRGRLNDYDFDMTLYYWLNSLSPGTEQMLYWSCESANQPARWNFAGICHPAVDAIASSIAKAKTREELVTRTHALDRILMWHYNMIPLYYAGKDFLSYRQFIHHPVTTPLYGPVLETWWAE